MGPNQQHQYHLGTFSFLFFGGGTFSKWKFLGLTLLLGFPGGGDGKEHACQCRRHQRHRFNPGLGRSPEGGHGNPLQCSCLENYWTEEPGGLLSLGLQSVRHSALWLSMCDLACMHIAFLSTLSFLFVNGIFSFKFSLLFCIILHTFI